MYISIKRKDSVTSILLFIFNVFLVERGITAIPLKKIFKLLEPFQKNETAIRMGLSREVESGLLINQRKDGEVYYYLTDIVTNGFKYWMKTMDFDQKKIQLQFQNWNGLWSFLLIGNDPEQSQDNLKDFFEVLKQLSFGSLNKNLWISPYNFNEQVFSQIHEQNLALKIYLFESRLTNNNSAADLALKIWPVTSLAKQYEKFLISLTEAAGSLDLDAYRGGGGCPFYTGSGWNFLKLFKMTPGCLYKYCRLIGKVLRPPKLLKNFGKKSSQKQMSLLTGYCLINYSRLTYQSAFFGKG